MGKYDGGAQATGDNITQRMRFAYWTNKAIDTYPEYVINIAFIYYYWYSALGPVWAETRAQSGDWYGSGTLHPGQVIRGSLPLLSPDF